QQRKEIHPDDAVNFVLMALIDTDDPGFLVLPTHRLLFGLDPYAVGALSSEDLGQYFVVRELGTAETSPAIIKQLAQAAEGNPSFVLSTAQHRWLLSLNEQGKGRMEESGHSEAWNALDVAVAHTLVLEALLGLSLADV